MTRTDITEIWRIIADFMAQLTCALIGLAAFLLVVLVLVWFYQQTRVCRALRFWRDGYTFRLAWMKAQ